MNIGTLFIVATPIGNLQDVTLRAIEVLKNVDYIACEDTRKSGNLLKLLKIDRKGSLISFYEQTEQLKIPNILNILINGFDVALVSDGGTPLISDPGFKLVREANKKNVKIISIPGPSASISALVTSGLPTDKFLFLGFLPRKEGHKTTLLQKVKEGNKELESTIIIYEAPHRLIKTLKSIENVFGDINLVICKELTKIHETIISDKLTNLIQNYNKNKPKGEYVILFNLKES